MPRHADQVCMSLTALVGSENAFRPRHADQAPFAVRTARTGMVGSTDGLRGPIRSATFIQHKDLVDAVPVHVYDLEA